MLRMVTLFERLGKFVSERVVHGQWTIILVHCVYGTFNEESVCLDPDEWVIAAPKSSSWLSPPSTFDFNGGVCLIGVGQTLRERLDLQRKNTILSARFRDAEKLDINGYSPVSYTHLTLPTIYSV